MGQNSSYISVTNKTNNVIEKGELIKPLIVCCIDYSKKSCYVDKYWDNINKYVNDLPDDAILIKCDENPQLVTKEIVINNSISKLRNNYKCNILSAIDLIPNNDYIHLIILTTGNVIFPDYNIKEAHSKLLNYNFIQTDIYFNGYDNSINMDFSNLFVLNNNINFRIFFNNILFCSNDILINNSDDIKKALSKVYVFRCNSCQYITNTEILKLSEVIPHLKYLCISNCNQISIIPKFNNLTNLDCSGCKNISDDSFNNFENLPKLIKFNCSGCTNVSDNSVQYLNPIEFSCRSNNIITDISISKFNNLERLYCDMCPNITDNSIEKLHKLTDISCINCTNITNYSILKLKNIQFVMGFGCPSLTDVAYEYVKKNQIEADKKIFG
jgi:hypothetical protein